jgi:hypothetical protein
MRAYRSDEIGIRARQGEFHALAYRLDEPTKLSPAGLLPSRATSVSLGSVIVTPHSRRLLAACLMLATRIFRRERRARPDAFSFERFVPTAVLTAIR